MNQFEQDESGTERIVPSVFLNPKEKFPSKVTPMYESKVIDGNSGEEVGLVEFQLNHHSRTLTIQHVSIDKPKQGYGVELYKHLQNLYPDYQLHSSDQMHAKENEEQEQANALYLWEKLIRLGLAEEDGSGGFRMKREPTKPASDE